MTTDSHPSPDAIALRLDGELRAVAEAAGHRRYPPRAGASVARAALAAFFSTGDPDDASAVAVSMCHGLETAADASHALVREGALAAAEAEALALAPTVGRAHLVEALRRRLEAHLSDLDPSRPLDLLAGASVVVCASPGVAGRPAEDAMTTHDGEVSTLATIRPDAALARLLDLANVGVADLCDEAARSLGHDPRRMPLPGEYADPEARGRAAGRARAWEGMRTSFDPSAPPLVTARRLVEGIENSPWGFMPLVAFRADAAWLVGRDWDLPLEVSGGMLGLHDPVNGSGHPQRFEGTVTLDVAPLDLALGEGHDCGLPESHGLAPSAFASSQRDGTARTSLPRARNDAGAAGFPIESCVPHRRPISRAPSESLKRLGFEP